MRDELEEITVDIEFYVVLNHSLDTETSYVQESVQSSAKLFFNNALKESNYVVKGSRGEGNVTLKEITSVIDSVSIDNTTRRELKMNDHIRLFLLLCANTS